MTPDSATTADPCVTVITTLRVKSGTPVGTTPSKSVPASPDLVDTYVAVVALGPATSVTYASRSPTTGLAKLSFTTNVLGFKYAAGSGDISPSLRAVCAPPVARRVRCLDF